MPNWMIKILGYTVVQWLIGTTLQLGLILTVIYTLVDDRLDDANVAAQGRMGSVEGSISNLVHTIEGARSALTAEIKEVDDIANDNTALLSAFDERFNSIDKEFVAVRSEINLGLEAIGKAIDRIDPVAAEPLKEMARVYWASLGPETKPKSIDEILEFAANRRWYLFALSNIGGPALASELPGYTFVVGEQAKKLKLIITPNDSAGVWLPEGQYTVMAQDLTGVRARLSGVVESSSAELSGTIVKYGQQTLTIQTLLGELHFPTELVQIETEDKSQLEVVFK